MLSYKQWKSLNESVLPSFNLGLGRPSNLGISSQFGFEEAKHGDHGKKMKKMKKMKGDSDLVEPAEKKDDPDVDVKLGDKGDVSCCGKCGSMAKKHGKKHCGMCMKSKKKMWSDEDDQEDVEGHEEEAEEEEDEAEVDEDDADADEEEADADEEEADEEEDDEANEAAKHARKHSGKYSKKMMGDDEHHEDDEDEDEDEDDEDHEEDHDEEDHDEEDHDEEDHEEEDHDEEDHDEDKKSDDKPMFMKKSKKKMLKGGQHKLDANKDGKISGEDFKILRKRKEEKKNEMTEEEAAWWKSVHSMIGNSDEKFSDGLFKALDMDNLYVGVRNEAFGSAVAGSVTYRVNDPNVMYDLANLPGIDIVEDEDGQGGTITISPSVHPDSAQKLSDMAKMGKIKMHAGPATMNMTGKEVPYGRHM